MLLHLFATAATTFTVDTIPVPVVPLLGELLEQPTYEYVSPAAEGLESGLIDIMAVAEPDPDPAPARVQTYVAFSADPLPPPSTPGMPVHPVEAPTDLGFTRAELDDAIRSVEQEVYRGGFPGAALAIGRWDRTVVERGFGTLESGLGSSPVDPDHTIYDLASLTKVIATTTAVMLLVEDGRMNLDAQVAQYLPFYTQDAKERVTIRHLLTHTSGLPAGGNTSGASPEESLSRALAVQLVSRPGEKVVYSDIGFIVLWAAAQAAYGGDLQELLRERVFQPLQMHQTGFNPGPMCTRCAPTLDRPDYRGVVHDPIARRLGGVTGHAGLFSTVHDLSRFAAMLVNGGELEGARILERATIDQFTRRQAGADTRALGWDTPDQRGRGAAGIGISSSAFGHTGFTGTSLWIDPDRGTWVVLLSNRTYRPNAPNRMQALRRELNDIVATSIDRSVATPYLNARDR